MSHTCRHCGKEVATLKGLSSHCSQIHNTHRIPESELRELYFDDGFSMRDIADEYDTSKCTIQNAFAIYEFDAREAYRSDSYPPRHEFQKISDSVGHEYEIVRSSTNYETGRVLIHRLVAVANGDLGTGELCDFDKIVHHKSNHGLDNRPENLEVMTRGDHGELHMKQRLSR